MAEALLPENIGNTYPLRRLRPGAWRSRDGHWTFLCQHNDPQPYRWFAYLDDDDDPANAEQGHMRLRDAVRWSRGEGARIKAERRA
jgi:hypothetical protein